MNEYGAFWKAEILEEETLPVPLWPAQILHGLAWHWTQFPYLEASN